MSRHRFPRHKKSSVLNSVPRFALWRRMFGAPNAISNSVGLNVRFRRDPILRSTPPSVSLFGSSDRRHSIAEHQRADRVFDAAWGSRVTSMRDIVEVVQQLPISNWDTTGAAIASRSRPSGWVDAKRPPGPAEPLRDVWRHGKWPYEDRPSPRTCRLSLQLLLQFVEETPVGALGQELLGVLLSIPTSCRPRA